MQSLILNHRTIKEVTERLTLVGRTVHDKQRDPLWSAIVDEKLFKTRGDLAADKMLVEGLTLITPKIPVFSEEHFHSIKDRPSLYWLIDPIDGTASWYNGFDGYVSQLALVKDNFVNFSAIYWPSHDTMFTASASGVFVKGKILTRPVLREPITLIDNYPTPTGLPAHFIDLIPGVSYRECGSLGLKSVLALTGEADLFVKDVVVCDWDMAPAMAFVNNLGGGITDFLGKPLELGKSIEFDKGLIVSHDVSLIDKCVNLKQEMDAFVI